MEIKDPSDKIFDTLRDVNDEQKQWIDDMRNAVKTMGSLLDQLPNSRRKSIALTQLETAIMFANKAATYGK